MFSYLIAKNGESVCINGTREECYPDGDSALSDESLDALRIVKSISRNKPLSDEHYGALDTLYADDVCISPYTIFKGPLNKDACRYLNDLSDLGQELRTSLAEVGAFKFLDALKQKERSEAIIERILAVFTMSTGGLWNTKNATEDFIHSIIDIFRSKNGLDWNRDLLGSGDIIPQCLSHVIIGLANIYGDNTLLAKSRKYRNMGDEKVQNWLEFSSSEEAVDTELITFFKDFKRSSKMEVRLAHSTIIDISRWLKLAMPGKSLREAVSCDICCLTFSDYLVSKREGKVDSALVAKVGAARTISEAMLEWYRISGDQGVMFQLVRQQEYQKLRNAIIRLPKPSSSRSRPLPEKFLPLLREILEGGPTDWVQTSPLFQVKIAGASEPVPRYCPVIPTLLLAMLEIPVRMGQLRRLDSGEGDVLRYDSETHTWAHNSSPHAGYWADLEGKPREGFETRGYAREITGENRSITGIFVNTNKTGLPHTIPWFLPRLLKLLGDLRDWQERYNPIPGPVGPGAYLDSTVDYPEASRIALPDIFPLARLFPTRYRPTLGRTVSGSEINRAWCSALGQLQGMWNDRHPGNLIRLVDIHPTNGQFYRPAYNLHGFRVRGLTNLHRGGMPLELISKLVAGHASLRMTLYYVHRDPVEVSDIIESAAARSAGDKRQFLEGLRHWELDEAKRRTVAISDAAIEEAIKSNSQIQFCNVAIGICPYDGTRCADGGALSTASDQRGAKRGVYGPVEPHACIMCRHFVSGPPWLNELAQYGTKLCEQRQYLGIEQARIGGTVFRLEEMLKAGKIERPAFENKFDELQAEICHIKDRQEVVENSIFNVELLCNASIQLINSQPENDDEVMLVANHRSTLVKFEEITEFEQAVHITAAGRIHKILGDERVEDKRNRYLDLMLFNSDIVPPRLLANITIEHCQRAMDQYALFVLSRVNSEEIAALTDGRLRLRDIGLESEVRELLDVALSDPAYLPEASIPHQILTAGSLEK